MTREGRDHEVSSLQRIPSAVIGSGDTCELPPVPATVFHHEPELALVIGKTATKVSQEEALSHVFGYCQFLDMSARGLQGAVGNSFFLGKCWDNLRSPGSGSGNRR
jgi:2-keto-4-pentenoate hydratase/2-oxohepta-3-ene-1,7-dioic acid hydratase in catechol pathway